MPSFDVVSEVDLAELKNAVLQARKELESRFDFKGVPWEIAEEKDKLVLSANDDFKLKALEQILMGKLAKRNISLKNIDADKAEISSVGRARQELKLKQGLESSLAKRISGDVRGTKLKVQAVIEGGKLRISGKSRDDLQAVIAFLRGQDYPQALQFNNFRD